MSKPIFVVYTKIKYIESKYNIEYKIIVIIFKILLGLKSIFVIVIIIKDEIKHIPILRAN